LTPPPDTTSDPLQGVRGTQPQDRAVSGRGLGDLLLAQNDAGTPSAKAGNSPKDQSTQKNQQSPYTVSKAVFRQKLIEARTQANTCAFGFGRASRTMRYDHNLFILVDSGENAYLQLLSDKKPSQAIDAIFSSTGVWSFDCFEFAEVLLLCALRRSLGPNSEQLYDRLVRDAFTSKSAKRAGGPIVPPEGLLKIKPKTDVLPLRAWYVVPSDAKGGSPSLTDRSAQGQAASMNQQQAEMAELGSLVTFTNKNHKPNSAWENENTVSLGDGNFIAWGFPAAAITVSASTIKEKLALEGIDAKKTDGIFITGVSVPDIPWQ